MKPLAFLLLLCTASPAPLSAQASAQPQAGEAAANVLIETNWSLGSPKVRKPVPKRQTRAARPARVARTQSTQPRITGTARARNGRGKASVGVKLPF